MQPHPSEESHNTPSDLPPRTLRKRHGRKALVFLGIIGVVLLIAAGFRFFVKMHREEQNKKRETTLGKTFKDTCQTIGLNAFGDNQGTAEDMEIREQLRNFYLRNHSMYPPIFNSRKRKGAGPFWIVKMTLDWNNRLIMDAESKSHPDDYLSSVLAPGINGYASSRREARTLVCIAIRHQRYPECLYQGGYIISREGTEMETTLIDVESLQLLESESWSGVPHPCPDAVSGNSMHPKMAGEPPSDDEILVWLRENIFTGGSLPQSPYIGRYIGEWAAEFSKSIHEPKHMGTWDIYVDSDGRLAGTETDRTARNTSSLKGFIEDNGHIEMLLTTGNDTNRIMGDLEKKDNHLAGKLTQYCSTGNACGTIEVILNHQ